MMAGVFWHGQSSGELGFPFLKVEFFSFLLSKDVWVTNYHYVVYSDRTIPNRHPVKKYMDVYTKNFVNLVSMLLYSQCETGTRNVP